MKHIKIEENTVDDDVTALFHQYLAVCNKAIKKHENEFPYQQMLSWGETLLGGRPIDLAVYDDEPKAAFSLYFNNHELKNDGDPVDARKAWRMNLSYLRNVVNHPDDYIEHPERLDLDWLKSRLGFN